MGMQSGSQKPGFEYIFPRDVGRNLGDLLEANQFNTVCKSRLVDGREVGTSITKPDLTREEYIVCDNQRIVATITREKGQFKVETSSIDKTYDKDCLMNSDCRISEKHVLVTNFNSLNKTFVGPSIRKLTESNREKGWRPRTMYRIEQ